MRIMRSPNYFPGSLNGLLRHAQGISLMSAFERREDLSKGPFETLFSETSQVFVFQVPI